MNIRPLIEICSYVMSSLRCESMLRQSEASQICNLLSTMIFISTYGPLSLVYKSTTSLRTLDGSFLKSLASSVTLQRYGLDPFTVVYVDTTITTHYTSLRCHMWTQGTCIWPFLTPLNGFIRVQVRLRNSHGQRKPYTRFEANSRISHLSYFCFVVQQQFWLPPSSGSTHVRPDPAVSQDTEDHADHLGFSSTFLHVA
jgi:hypothetical protein